MKVRWTLARLFALFRQRKLDWEVNAEILAHLELAELDARTSGLTPEEARQAARRNFGGIEQMKEDHRDHGESWVSHQRSHAISKVSGQVFDQPHAAVIAVVFLHLFDSSEIAPACLTRLLRR